MIQSEGAAGCKVFSHAKQVQFRLKKRLKNSFIVTVNTLYFYVFKLDF